MARTKTTAASPYATKEQAGVARERKTVIVERELHRLYSAHGVLSAEIVLGAATSTRSPLHKYFEWDDSEAARKYRLQQATNLILGAKFVVMLQEQEKNSLPTAVRAQPVQVRQLVSAFRGEGFRMRNEVMNDAEMRTAMIAKKIQTLRHWCDEACDFPELKKLRRSILKLLPPA